MDFIIETTKGKVEGFETEGVNAWYGIPFAKAPIGDLRFKRAQPMDSWEGVKECKTYSNMPIQFMGGHEEENEDCLYLNVWAPKEAKKKPVFVWIYGGGFHYGYNSDKSYDGVHMAESDAVYVNINYRLGSFGFYDFNQFDQSFDTNCAISDQIAALKWVKENIEAFGGDPDNITIAGESAGGSSVYCLLASPAAKGLFNKAIAQSGIAQACGSREFTKLITPVFLKYLGLKPEEIGKIKSMDTATIRKATCEFYTEFTKEYSGIFMPGPFFGDDLLPEHPWTAMKNGSAEGVDVIFGYNHDEGDTFAVSTPYNAAWFGSWEVVEAMLKNNGKEQYFSELKAVYSKFDTEFRQLSEFSKDYLFVKDALRCADEQLKYGNVWTYRFDFVPTANKSMNMGATHAVEVPFALNTMDRGYFAYQLKGTPQDQLEALRDQMNGAWLNFMKTGNPNGGIVEWAKYDRENCTTHIFDLQPSNQPNTLDDVRVIWEKLGLMYDKE